MTGSKRALASFIRAHEADILRIWQREAAAIPGRMPLSPPALLDDIGNVLLAIADRLDPGRAISLDDVAESAVGEHALQHAEIGSTLVTITAELLALRDAIEEAWPQACDPDGKDVIGAMRRAAEQVMLASMNHFIRLRLGVLASVDEIVRAWDPHQDLTATLERMLQVLLRTIDGIDTLAVLLREEGDILRVRAAVGLEEAAKQGFSVPVGRGFAGLIAAERSPRLLHAAHADPRVLSPFLRAAGVRALYGVPLVSRGELLGVAHMGSLSAHDFADEAKALFRALVARLVGVIHQDILYERLDEERNRYRAIFDNAPAVIYSKDRDGRYVTINARPLAELGLAPEDFIGHTDAEVFPPEVARALRATDRRVVETKAEIEHEEPIHVGAEPRWFLTTKFPLFDARGRVAGVAGVSTDITERRRQTRGQAMLLEAGSLLASSLDYVGNLNKLIDLVVSELAECSLVYLLDDEDVIQPPLVRHRDPSKADVARRCCLAPRDERPHLVDTVLKTCEAIHMKHVPARYLETIAVDEEHHAMMLELGLASMIQIPLVARGHMLGAWVFTRGPESRPFDEIDRDLASELCGRVSLAIDNSRLYAASRRATRARDEVLGVVAHDLRTPLSTITLAVESLGRAVDPARADATRGVKAIRRAARRMEKLVEDLLDQQAIERGRLEVAPSTWPARALLEEIAEEHAARIEAAALSLEIGVPPGLPDVAADRDRVLQVFGNLLSNAVKFTPRGGRIRVGARVQDSEVVFWVRDTGAGMSRESLHHLFDRYWQAKREDRRGVGLGLAIAKGIVEAHGGAIWARSTPGEGTVVCFTLPCARDDAAHRLH